MGFFSTDSYIKSLCRKVNFYRIIKSSALTQNPLKSQITLYVNRPEKALVVGIMWFTEGCAGH